MSSHFPYGEPDGAGKCWGCKEVEPSEERYGLCESCYQLDKRGLLVARSEGEE